MSAVHKNYKIGNEEQCCTVSFVTMPTKMLVDFGRCNSVNSKILVVLEAITSSQRQQLSIYISDKMKSMLLR